MKFKIKAQIEIDDLVNVDILSKTISPENSTFHENDGMIESKIENDRFVTNITGRMKIGTLLNTIDDIIKTAIFTKKIIDDNELN